MDRQTKEGEWELFHYDPLTTTTIWTLHQDDKYYVRTERYVGDQLEVNTKCRNANDKNWKGDMHLVASIPTHIFYDTSLRDASMQHDEKHVKRWLNDSDNRAWRVKEGHL